MSERNGAEHLDATRAYYDEFSTRYEAQRDGHDPGGYHDLLDELEVAFVERYGRGKDVLEVGCGTGLLLRKIARFARSARGVDLSPGMLAHARERGLDVLEGAPPTSPSPTPASTWPARSRCSLTCKTSIAPSPRWPA